MRGCRSIASVPSARRTRPTRGWPPRAATGPPRSPALHPLLGIPVGLKDLVSVQGGQCTAGSRILEGYIAPYDAHITERLRDVGAVFLGKTNMDEFAMGSSNEHSAFGPAANPWDLDRVPGGSSGGSAAAVAAYHVPLAIGTDTGGSIRQPAALTGIVGMKPTYGRVSRYGIVAFASSLDQIGPFARDARDAAALLHAVAGRDDRDSTSAPGAGPGRAPAPPRRDDEAAAVLKGKRLGLPREYFVAGMEPGVEARVREAVAALEAAGAIVEDVSLPHTDYGLATYYIVAPAEASATWPATTASATALGAATATSSPTISRRAAGLRRRGQAPDHARDVRPVGRLLRRVLPQGAEGPDAHQARLRRGLRDRIDALVAPTSPSVAFRFGASMADPVAMYLSDACTLPVNMAGLPGFSVPCGLSEGLPVGLQLIGAPWSELELLRLARATRPSPQPPPGARSSPPISRPADDPAGPTPVERAAALAVAPDRETGP